MTAQFDENGEIKAGTTEKLVEALYNEANPTKGPEYANVFLLTYRSFMATREVLDLLLAGYNNLLRGNTEATKTGRLKYRPLDHSF